MVVAAHKIWKRRIFYKNLAFHLRSYLPHLVECFFASIIQYEKKIRELGSSRFLNCGAI